MKRDVIWTCPECDTNNIDVYGETAEPMCEQCFHEPGWNWVLAQPRRATRRDLFDFGVVPDIIETISVLNAPTPPAE